MDEVSSLQMWFCHLTPEATPLTSTSAIYVIRRGIGKSVLLTAGKNQNIGGFRGRLPDSPPPSHPCGFFSDREFGIVYSYIYLFIYLFLQSPSIFLTSNIGVHNLGGDSIPNCGFETVSVGNWSFSFTQNYILSVLFKEWTVTCCGLLLQKHYIVFLQNCKFFKWEWMSFLQ